jgi:hypothetical protein
MVARSGGFANSPAAVTTSVPQFRCGLLVTPISPNARTGRVPRIFNDIAEYWALEDGRTDNPLERWYRPTEAAIGIALASSRPCTEGGASGVRTTLPIGLLRKLIAGQETIVALGAYDALTARIIEQAGFPAVS